MGSDIARRTYDRSRQYRAVVMQQGRVTVEADWNEEWQIVNEEERKEALDVVGPSGTPDDGYHVMPVAQAPFDFAVSEGTMYVGGIRVALDNPVQYSRQLEWIDHPQDPTWVNPHDVARAQTRREFIYLYLREQEVSAVEDTVLREVALGGPDTAQRTRLVQRIVRAPTQAEDCPSALEQAAGQWAAKGLAFDPNTMRLMPAGKLQVGFTNVVTNTDPCEPQARGGYLGAANQLIRVQISAYNKESKSYTLIWGFDNASFLYRVQVGDDLKTLTLQSRPVDDFHKPKKDQAVEILAAAVQLDASDTSDYVAEATGIVTTLDADYVSDTQTISLTEALPQDYGDSGKVPVVFLRVWQEEKSFTPGTPVPLGTTGLQVTFTGQPLYVGDYWIMAVRPDTGVDPNSSADIFPHRYLAGPQSPDGPRLWVCPLAVVEWDGKGDLTEYQDCRNLFDNLVDLTKRNLGGCCNVTVGPEDIAGNKTLQSVIDKYSKKEQVTVCLMPGTYALAEPLRLGSQHSNLTLEGCHHGVTIQAAAGSEKQFLDGLIVLTGANNVTIQGLHFELPLVPFYSRYLASSPRIAGLHPSEVRNLVGAQLQNLQVSIGIRPLDCAALTIKDCYFHFPQAGEQNVFGAGIFAGSECHGLTVQDNRFVRPGDVLPTRESPFGFLFGYLLVPTTTFNPGSTAATTTTAIAARGGTAVLSLLQDATFRDNLFMGLSAAALIFADIGAARFERNAVRNCYAGFWLLSLFSLPRVALAGNISVSSARFDSAQQLLKWVYEIVNDPLILIGATLARSYPLPKEFDLSKTTQAVPVKVAAKAEVDYTPIQTFLNKAFQASATETAGETTGEKQVKLNLARIPLVNSLFASQTGLGRFSAIQGLLATTERAALAARIQPPTLHPALHMSDNDINTILSNNIQSSTALLVWDSEQDIASTMTMSANKVRNRSFMPTALMLSVERCAITGNLILNEERQELLAVLADGQNYLSLIFPFGVGVAITGNVFQGTPLLPNPRAEFASLGSPMNTWEFLNTKI